MEKTRITGYSPKKAAAYRDPTGASGRNYSSWSLSTLEQKQSVKRKQQQCRGVMDCWQLPIPLCATPESRQKELSLGNKEWGYLFMQISKQSTWFSYFTLGISSLFPTAVKYTIKIQMQYCQFIIVEKISMFHILQSCSHTEQTYLLQSLFSLQNILKTHSIPHFSCCWEHQTKVQETIKKKAMLHFADRN